MWPASYEEKHMIDLAHVARVQSGLYRGVRRAGHTTARAVEIIQRVLDGKPVTVVASPYEASHYMHAALTRAAQALGAVYERKSRSMGIVAAPVGRFGRRTTIYARIDFVSAAGAVELHPGSTVRMGQGDEYTDVAGVETMKHYNEPVYTGEYTT